MAVLGLVLTPIAMVITPMVSLVILLHHGFSSLSFMTPSFIFLLLLQVCAFIVCLLILLL